MGSRARARLAICSRCARGCAPCCAATGGACCLTPCLHLSHTHTYVHTHPHTHQAGGSWSMRTTTPTATTFSTCARGGGWISWAGAEACRRPPPPPAACPTRRPRARTRPANHAPPVPLPPQPPDDHARVPGPPHPGGPDVDPGVRARWGGGRCSLCPGAAARLRLAHVRAARRTAQRRRTPIHTRADLPPLSYQRTISRRRCWARPAAA